MAHRIEITTKVNDAKSEVMKKKLNSLGFKATSAKVIEVYTINKPFNRKQIEEISQMLANPISQTYLINTPNNKIDFTFAVEIGFLPGVTDNIAHTAKESIEDLLKTKFKDKESVHSSTLILIKGNITETDANKIGDSLANNLIQRIHIKSKGKFLKDKGMDTVVPEVKLTSHPKADKVNLDIPDEELIKIGKDGILNKDGTRRGPLALDKESLYVIKDYFKKLKRQPTDVELESLAQTWSEHCKHTIFAAKIDDNEEGLYKGFIKKATEEIRKKKGKQDFCVSVFSDNSGAIIFDEKWLITDKAETHNSPSALDPFGGAITGIVGVNRDTIGFGKGAKPIVNIYGYCVGYPDDEEPIFKDKELKNKALSPKRILNGIVEGVNSGGNCSGIPTPQGFVYFNDKYKGKPLVFVGTVGLIPRKINNKPSWEKSAKPGDEIVMIGGRVGQDGIHGATFSSEALSSGSPATAVQIGDPITQKKLSDAIVKEARAMDLYTSITDNGAGGLSCSVAEMAKECNGCEVQLDKVPLKYPNLEPWKIWISESQERMTFSISQKNLKKFMDLMKKRGVEATVIGKFTNTGRCIVKFKNEKIMDIDLEFLHNGLPKKSLDTIYPKNQYEEPVVEKTSNWTSTLLAILQRPNNGSFEFISRQYDHEVQGGSVLKPLQGKGEVNANVSITRPVLDSEKGVVLSYGINPTYSDINTYHMAASAIDTAIRNVVAAGGNLNHLALMDNFCWCSSNEAERLGQLKGAVQACYDYSIAYETPFISGKDSMFNDFKGFDVNGNQTKISVPPTLLISSISVIDDVTKAVSLDPKFAGDLVYILGTTFDELGGSEYFAHLNCVGNSVPKVNAQEAISLYRKVSKAIDRRLISSALSPSIGGLAIALAKKSIAGQLGMDIDLRKVPRETALTKDNHLLFSESQSRIIVTIAPQNRETFEKLFTKTSFRQIGEIRNDQKFIVTGLNGKTIIKTDVKTLNTHYRETFKNY